MIFVGGSDLFTPHNIADDMVCTSNTEQFDLPSDSGNCLFISGKINFFWLKYVLNTVFLKHAGTDEQIITTDESGIIPCFFYLLTVIGF
jgi:hypothetical protein